MGEEVTKGGGGGAAGGDDERIEENGRAVHFPAFPFQPYPIQLEFMRAVYEAIQKGGVAIVESPTGTGKTLSLICSALQWLMDHHLQKDSPTSSTAQKTDSMAAGTGAEDAEPDWMSNYESQHENGVTKPKAGRKWVPKSKALINLGDNVRKKSSAVLTFGGGGEQSVKRERKGENAHSKPAPYSTGDKDDDDQFIVEEYCSDEESAKDSKRKMGSLLSSSSSGEDTEDDEEAYEPLKVFFCSRTHSQLSQFIGELQRTVFSSTLRAVSLGSRKNLCINSEVSKLGSSARINDRCLELQNEKYASKSGSKIQAVGLKTKRKSRVKGCPMMSKQKLQKRFVEEALQGDALDMEDLVDLGNKLGTCPYYGSRRMVPKSDLVVLPYQSLLHSATRESLGIDLKDSVVVIDEAHNLVDTVSNIYSCQVSESQLKQVNAQLSEYLEKFRKRLAATNRRYIEMLLGIIRSFIRFLANSSDTHANPVVIDGANRASAKGKLMTINDFLFSLEIDNVNLFKIRKYIKESNIVHKVSSYGEKYFTTLMGVVPNGTTAGGATDKSSFGNRASLTGFHTLAEFVLALTNADSDGRVLVMPSTTRGADSSLKFIMLNAAKHFAEVLNHARAVVLAGGTLQPVDELRVRLFPHLPEDRVHIFGCGHIVPPESILPLAIARGPSNQVFDFTYQSRSSPVIMEELGRLINNISITVPDGIVVFFPSFEYENQVFNRWKSSNLLTSIECRKTVFREPRDAASVEGTLQVYRESILSQTKDGKKTGALLLCVVGGKMSEGINFSDGMGRCVVMVGLPYPSPNDPELMERMRYIDHLDKTRSVLGRSGQKGREYYENLCMKAVNQSIGRAIRHIGDYAAILLVDVRYTNGSSFSGGGGGARVESGPASKLPGWIKERFQITEKFGEVHKQLHQFFKYNKFKVLELKS
ncbi:unnamed protein product [Calypogeia fissa]